MQLVAEVQQGFEALPTLWMVLVQLDLTSAYNHVEHTELLHIFAKLKIPAIYARFYSGFLSGRTFHVRCGNSFSKPVHKACGVPQGTVSSPILFLIYMEDMLRTVLPMAE